MNKKKTGIIILVVFALAVIGVLMMIQKNKTIYLDATQPIDKRIKNLMSHLTLEEKVALCHGNSKFTIAAIDRLGIPEMVMSDGPCGVREEGLRDTWGTAGRSDDSSTALPSQVVLACSWNVALALEQGKVLGSEARFRDKDIILAPGLNIHRTPLCGRNFEYMGEDPYLTSQMVVQHIKGVQSQGTAACVKHYLANNQEYERNIVDVEMDERALREIYLPAFKAAVEEAGALAVMGSYNKFRGQHCCHNKYLLQDILKGEMKFKGLVMSDWDGCHSTEEAVNNGLDLEMGTEGGKKYNEYYLADPFLKGLKDGKYSEDQLDDKVYRVLYVVFKTRMASHRPAGAFNTSEHQKHCLHTAQEGIVLLKNEKNILPLDITKINSIAIIGENAVIKHSQGGGSATIKAKYEITPLVGIQKKCGDKIKIQFAQGYSRNDSADRKKLIKEAVKMASHSQVTVIFAGLTHVAFENKGKWSGWDCEGFDNNTWELPWQQDELIKAVLKVNPRTIVFLTSGSPYDIKEISEKVPALLYSSYAGMEAGNAFANILFGDVNPSGKLCFSYPVKLHDSPAHAQGQLQYPGVNHHVKYSEGILVGYRWYDKKEIAPLFPFGYGLSYTTFEYSDLKLSAEKIKENDSIIIKATIKNTGLREGAEISQLYIQDLASSVMRPVKELKGFKKTLLNPGESKEIEFIIHKDALSFWSKKTKNFVAEPGKFKVLIGSSSRDIKMNHEFELIK